MLEREAVAAAIKALSADQFGAAADAAVYAAAKAGRVEHGEGQPLAIESEPLVKATRVFAPIDPSDVSGGVVTAPGCARRDRSYRLKAGEFAVRLVRKSDLAEGAAVAWSYVDHHGSHHVVVLRDGGGKVDRMSGPAVSFDVRDGLVYVS